MRRLETPHDLALPAPGPIQDCFLFEYHTYCTI
jgi:hypothetical protein